MKIAIYLPIALLVMLTGCNTYQLVSIESPLNKTENSEFIHENDTFRITYTFNGWNCPINIYVYNKIDKPIYVDWSKSSVIIDNQRINYWNNQASLLAMINDTGINGTIFNDEKVSFIPPSSGISVSRINLKNEFVHIPDNFKHDIVNLPTVNGYAKTKKYIFPEMQEPLMFRSFITLSVTQDFNQPIYTDDTFWISDVIRTPNHPDYILNKPSNQFYLQQSTGFGKFLLATSTIVLIIAGLMATE